MPKPLVITKIQYIGTGKAEISKLSGMAKYYQYRDGSVRRDTFAQAAQDVREAGLGYPQNVSDYVKPQNRDIRWVDRGMGDTHRKIVRRAVELAGRRTTARMWIISPDPELMEHIPQNRRMEVLQRTTELTIAYWYDDNGWGSPRYSYVMHDKERRHDGKQMLHTHVVTPGTYDLGDRLGRMDHVVRKPHLRSLHEITHEVFMGEMEHVLGRERAARIVHERDEFALDERYPGRKQQQGYERRERLGKMQQVHDVTSIMKREQERKRRKRERRKKSSEMKRRQRQEDLRIYTHYHRQRERRTRQQDYAARRAEWERKRQQWREEHIDDLAWAHIDDQTWQMRLAGERREAERLRTRRENIEVIKRTWGWHSWSKHEMLTYFSDAELAELAAPHKQRESPALDID